MLVIRAGLILEQRANPAIVTSFEQFEEASPAAQIAVSPREPAQIEAPSSTPAPPIHRQSGSSATPSSQQHHPPRTSRYYPPSPRHVPEHRPKPPTVAKRHNIFPKHGRHQAPPAHDYGMPHGPSPSEIGPFLPAPKTGLDPNMPGARGHPSAPAARGRDVSPHAFAAGKSVGMPSPKPHEPAPLYPSQQGALNVRNQAANAKARAAAEETHHPTGVAQASTPRTATGPGSTPATGSASQSANPNFTRENADAVRAAAARIGISPQELATAIAYETRGTFSPHIIGGTRNRYMGLIQFGPSERAQYGANQQQTFIEQLPAVERYLADRGFQPGSGLRDLYSTINAGRPGRYHASDRPGMTVDRHVARMIAERSDQAREFLESGTPRSTTPPTQAPSVAAGRNAQARNNLSRK